MPLSPDDYATPRQTSRLSPSRIRSGLLRRLRAVLFRNDPKVRRSIAGLTRGLRLSMDFRIHSLVLFGLYEVELAPHIRRLYTRGSTAFDVGAHDGYYSLILAKRGRDRVLAVEPDPQAREVLVTVLRANPALADLVEVEAALVGADAHGDCTTLDALARRPGGFLPDLLKIDAEGAEADVLRGAAWLLRERQPHVILETHRASLERDCLKLLEDAGYEPEVVEQRKWLRESRPLRHNRWIVAPGRPRS